MERFRKGLPFDDTCQRLSNSSVWEICWEFPSHFVSFSFFDNSTLSLFLEKERDEPDLNENDLILELKRVSVDVEGVFYKESRFQRKLLYFTCGDIRQE